MKTLEQAQAGESKRCRSGIRHKAWPAAHHKATAVVLHSVPGRVRFSMSGIAGDRVDHLAARLARKPGVRDVRTNRLTGNFVLCYRTSDTSQECILRAAESIANRLSGSQVQASQSKIKSVAVAQRAALQIQRHSEDASEAERRRRKMRRMIARYGPEVAMAILGIGLSAVEGPLGIAFAGLAEVGRLTRMVRRRRP